MCADVSEKLLLISEKVFSKITNKRAIMALDRSSDPFCTNEMVGNIRWSRVFE